jgi:hypothetical protein
MTKEQRESLTPAQEECFRLNDRIYDEHVEFDRQVCEATSLETIRVIADEFIGLQEGQLDLACRFGALLNSIKEVKDPMAALILASSFNGMQEVAKRHFLIAIARCEGLGFETDKPTEVPAKKEWN